MKSKNQSTHPFWAAASIGKKVLHAERAEFPRVHLYVFLPGHQVLRTLSRLSSPPGRPPGPSGRPSDPSSRPSDPSSWPLDPLVGWETDRQMDGQMDRWMDGVSPQSTGLCLILGPLPCYPLRLHNIKGAGPWKRQPHDAFWATGYFISNHFLSLCLGVLKKTLNICLKLS